MDDPARMCSRKSVGNLNRDRQRAAQIERTATDQFANVLAFDVLHGDEVHACNFIQIENGADIRMVERRRQPRFALESLEVGFFES